jgi:hypothetical protein
MNQRIRQLIKTKSTILFPGTDTVDCEITDIEKFAQLIVRECVGVADDYVKDCTCDEHKNCKHPRSIIGRKIKEHFGVEE